MRNTSLKQKLLLVTFGAFLAVILLETGLRMAGALVFFLQERHNHLSFNPNEYRILCLGESTTALGGEDSYPSQLEGMLNAENPPKKFTVINEGIISTTTSYILAHLDQNLDKYRPQLVVLMMGINDKVYLHGPYKTLWWENVKSYFQDFRVYKLAHLLYEHITHRIKEINTPAKAVDLPANDDDDPQHVENFLKIVIASSVERFSEHMSASVHYQQEGQLPQARTENQFAKLSAIAASSACVELARRYRFEGLFQEAQSVLEQATIFNVNYQDIYQEWGELYLAQGKSAQAVKAFQASLGLSPQNSDVIRGLARAYHQEHRDEAFIIYAGYLQIRPQDYWGYIELAQWLREDKHYNLAQEYLGRAIKIGHEFEEAYVDSGQILDDQGQYKEEEAFYLKEISDRPQSPRLTRALGELYQNQGRGDLAKAYLQKAAQEEVGDYSPTTLVNYSLVLNKILSRHVKVVVMQYPVRDISPLKNYLGQKKGVFYVENRQNFKQALGQRGFWYYFKDNFAYDFGHCTRAGNELIAQNLAEVILKKVLGDGQY